MTEATGKTALNALSNKTVLPFTGCFIAGALGTGMAADAYVIGLSAVPVMSLAFNFAAITAGIVVAGKTTLRDAFAAKAKTGILPKKGVVMLAAAALSGSVAMLSILPLEGKFSWQSGFTSPAAYCQKYMYRSAYMTPAAKSRIPLPRGCRL